MSNCPVLMISVCAPIRGAAVSPATGAVATGAVVEAGPRSLPPAALNGTGWAGAAALEEEEQAAKLRPTSTNKVRTARLLFVTLIGPLHADCDGQPSSTPDAIYSSRVPLKVQSRGGCLRETTGPPTHAAAVRLVQSATIPGGLKGSSQRP